MLIIFQILVLVFSVIIHEISHGFMALKFGDRTAKDAGRLTLNPIKHLDPFGSILLPIMLAFIHAPVIGWARPVPYDPRNLSNPKKQAGLIALAGPISNVLVAVVVGLLVRALVAFGAGVVNPEIIGLLNIIVLINLALAVFNLIPIPPLDGSGILFSLLPSSLFGLQRFLTRYGIFILIFLIFYGLNWLGPVIVYLQYFISGPAGFVGL